METLNLFPSRVLIFEIEGAAELNAALLQALISESEETPGVLAANHLLAPQGVRPEPIRSIPRRGLLGRRPVETAESRMR